MTDSKIDLVRREARRLLWATDEGVEDWMSTPNVRLARLTPIQWLMRHNADAVLDAIRAEAQGAYE